MSFNLKRERRIIKLPNLIPLINIIFILLIFFMVAGKMEKIDTIKIALPNSSSLDTAAKIFSKIIIYVGQDGKIAVNGDTVKDTDLSIIIRTLLLDNPDTNINIKADSNLESLRLIWLMDNLKQSGAKSISIFTEMKRN